MSVREIGGETRTLWNSMEGYTSLWELESGESRGSVESYAGGSGKEGSPGTCLFI